MPSVAATSESSISKTDLMERFRVSVHNQAHLIGIPEPGVLSVAITAVTRRDPRPGLSSRGSSLSLGALDSSTSDYTTWAPHDLEVGDRIEIEVFPEGRSDKPMSSKKIGQVVQEAKENAGDPQELEREDVRRAAAVLGWSLIEGDVPPPSTLPASSGESGAMLVTRNMERFRISIRDKSHVIGVPGHGVVSVHVNASVRQDPERGPDHECSLSFGALDSDSDTYLDWPKYDLCVGDLVVVEILPEGPFDEPVTRRSEKQTSAAYYNRRRDEIRQRAQALGWTVIEDDFPQH